MVTQSSLMIFVYVRQGKLQESQLLQRNRAVHVI